MVINIITMIVPILTLVINMIPMTVIILILVIPLINNFNPGDLSLVIVAGAAEGSEALPVSRVERGRSREVHPPADH